MKFIQGLQKAATEPQCSITDIVNKNVGGYVPCRSRTTVHASDVTNPEFCPRKVALLLLEEIIQHEDYIPTPLQMTFDVGEATAQLFKDKWAGQNIVGHWHCRKCSEQRTFCRKPLTGVCKDFRPHDWMYDEVKFRDAEYDVVCSLDALMDLGGPKLFITEVKIKDKDMFKALKVPEPEHRGRTQLYMRAMANSDFVYRDKINLDYSKVLYISRGFGAIDKQAGGVVTPLKEYTIPRYDEGCQPYMDKAVPVRVFKDVGEVPTGICPSALAPMVKACECGKVCFSGKYPAGSVHKVEAK